MNPGDYCYRFVLQSKAATRDAVGGEVINWRDELIAWGAVKPLRGSELLAAQQRHAETSLRFCMRYRRGVIDGWRVGWRLVWEGNAYDITEIADVDGRHIEMELDCTTGLRLG